MHLTTTLKFQKHSPEIEKSVFFCTIKTSKDVSFETFKKITDELLLLITTNNSERQKPSFRGNLFDSIFCALFLKIFNTIQIRLTSGSCDSFSRYNFLSFIFQTALPVLDNSIRYKLLYIHYVDLARIYFNKITYNIREIRHLIIYNFI